MNYPIMSSIQHHNFIDQDNFLAGCLLEFDFSCEFGFGSDFSSIFGNGWDDTLSYDNDDVSCEVSIEGFVKLKRKRKRKKRRKNRSYRLDSVKNSCWFTNFLQPGKVRSLTYDLSSSDRFGEFRHWFRMPLSKVESLVDTFIERGYIVPSRSQLHKDEFRERAETSTQKKHHYSPNRK